MQAFTITLTAPEFRALAVALAESSRRRTREDEDGPAARALARSLSDHVGTVSARGSVLLGLTSRETRLSREALLAADERPRYYRLPTDTSYRGLAARLEA